jgi:hypothetical protein
LGQDVSAYQDEIGVGGLLAAAAAGNQGHHHENHRHAHLKLLPFRDWVPPW